ncbi:MAG: hypothetical protein IJP52_01705 [Paludibacteraceae bacterium]|nr:hypothetical protein [Paludibacteraceae bacterium]
MKKTYTIPVVTNNHFDLCGPLMGPGPAGSPLNPMNQAPERVGKMYV